MQGSLNLAFGDFLLSHQRDRVGASRGQRLLCSDWSIAPQTS